MHKIDIQHGQSFTTRKPDGTYDVCVNHDHYMTYPNHAEAIEGAREAAGDGREDAIIRDYTRPTDTAKFTVVEPNLPVWPSKA